MGYVDKVNVSFPTTLHISFDGNVPTFLKHSLSWAEISGSLLCVHFSAKLCDSVELHTSCVLMEHQCAVKC